MVKLNSVYQRKKKQNKKTKCPLDFCTEVLPIKCLKHRQTLVFPLKYEGLTQLEKNQKKNWKLKMEVSVNLCILGDSWLSLTPEPSIVSMEPWGEGTSCHKEFRSGRVVAVGVNSIGEEINVWKVIPPGFIMILWGEKKETLLALARGAEKVKEGTRMLSGPLERRRSCYVSMDPRRLVLMDKGPHFSKWH